MAKWRWYAEREYPRVVRDLKLPCARPTHRHGNTCPLHEGPIGPHSRMCLTCCDTAWAEVGRRYAAHGTRQPEHDEKEEPQMTIADTEILEPELPEPDEPDEQLPAVRGNLFATTSPETFLVRAAETASVLAKAVNDRGLYTTIRGRKHVHVGGWTLLGSLLGVFPITVWTRKLDDGWEARVEARTRAGELVGAAESMCTTKETKWRNADEYAIRSMAATRATSKALRLPLGFIFELEGFDATPFEEIPVDETTEPTHGETVKRRRPDLIRDEDKPTETQVTELLGLLEKLGAARPEVDWKARAKELAGTSADMLTAESMEALLGKLKDELGVGR
jgi:hypothetical protein